MELCPVCTQKAVKKEISGIIDGIIYYFCCEGCKKDFMAEPQKFVNCCEDSKIARNCKSDEKE